MTEHLITPPAEEPVSLAEAKAHLRLDGSDEDAYVSSLIAAAREHVETDCGRALLTQTWDLYLEGWPAGGEIEIPRPPLRSVQCLAYTPAAGSETVWDAAHYLVDAVREPGRIVLGYGKVWPSGYLRPTMGIRVRFCAGWTGPGEVPQPIRQAVLLLVGHWFKNREAVLTGREAAGGSSILAMAVNALLASYRVWRF